jgi:hypothetical protein
MKKEHKSKIKTDFDSLDVIDFDINDKKDKLETSEIFKIKDILWVKRYKENNNKDKESYLVKYVPNMFTYIGFTDESLKRNGLGINIFSNKDIYIGKWENDYQEGEGFYLHHLAKHSLNYTEIFLGQWDRNIRVNGLYFWSETLSSNTLNEENYDLFYGKFKDNMYHNGVYISKRTENNKIRFYLYKGEFIVHNNVIMKHGENSVLFSLDERKFIIGTVIKDKLEYGKVYILNENEYSIKSIYDCKFNEINNKPIPNQVDQINVTNEQKTAHEKTLKSIKTLIENPEYLTTLNALLKYQNINGVDEFEKSMDEIGKLLVKYKSFALK